MLEQYCQQVAQGVVDKYGFTVPWELILEMVMELIDKCVNNNQDFVAVAKHPTVLQRVALNVYVRRVLDISNRRRVVAVADTIFETAAGLSDAELAGAYNEAQAVLQSQ